MKLLLYSFVLLIFILTSGDTIAQGVNTAVQEVKLTGTVIGTQKSVDYNTNKASTTVNTRECAFDDNLNTFFAAYERSYAWVGLDLGEQHVITRIGWSPARLERGAEKLLLGVFEGANTPDFMDALPLYIITQTGSYGMMNYAKVINSKGFRYVRYVGPANEQCNIAEIEFYGYKGEGNDSSLYRLTNLPTVSIHTENNVEPYDKLHDINALITVISDKGKELRTDSGGVRWRGNYSINFPKKPYRIKFNKKHKMLDAPAKAKKWTLISNYGDKTLMRNLLAFELSRCFDMPYTPYAQPVDVLLNGEYKGCYQLCDHIDVKKNRVELVDTLTEERTDSLSITAYLVEVDARASGEPCWFKSKKGNPVTIHYPDNDEITELQKTYIEENFNRMEDQWEEYLDLKTFLRHFLVGELSGNTDTYWSTYMYKHRENDTIFTGPVWDFDIAFENDKRTYPINSKTDFVYRSGGSVTGNMRTFVDNVVIRNADAKAQLFDIWGKARRDRINEQHLMAYIDSMELYLQESQKLNFTRWPVMNELVHMNPSVAGSYEAEVENVRRFISERLLWLDKKIGYTYEANGIMDVPVDIAHPNQIFNMSGQSYKGDIQHLPRGIYIVRQGNHARKVQMR